MSIWSRCYILNFIVIRNGFQIYSTSRSHWRTKTKTNKNLQWNHCLWLASQSQISSIAFPWYILFYVICHLFPSQTEFFLVHFNINIWRINIELESTRWTRYRICYLEIRIKKLFNLITNLLFTLVSSQRYKENDLRIEQTFNWMHVQRTATPCLRVFKKKFYTLKLNHQLFSSLSNKDSQTDVNLFFEEWTDILQPWRTDMRKINGNPLSQYGRTNGQTKCVRLIPL